MRSAAPLSPLLLPLIVGAAVILTSCADVKLNSSTPSSPAKRTPVISWPQPAPIVHPTPLSSAQLDATANVPGAFVYTPTAGAVLGVGTQTLSATFTPTDTADYNSATASVTIIVEPSAVSAGCPPTNTGPVTGSGHLAVADTNNGRVLIFDAPFVTGECASAVLGQADFESDVMLTPESSTKLVGPMGMAADATGSLYVADYNGGRIMQFRPPFTNGMNASLELGKPRFDAPQDFNGLCEYAPTAMSLCMPAAVTVDNEGNIWVADTWEGRVVEYQPTLQQGMAASVEIGQSGWNQASNCDGTYSIARDNTGAAMTTTASDFCNPASTGFDKDGNLWVADAGNDRVLEFIPPFSMGMAASLEIGFPTSVGMASPTPFADNWTCPQEAYFCGPGSIAFDATGDLWVADSGNHRILEFVPPFSSGMAASLVIGQPDLNRKSNGSPAANTLNTPGQIAFDADGDLIVSDQGNNRVLIFVPPFANGMNASIVLGQPDMTTITPHGCGDWTVGSTQFGEPSASTLCGPTGVLAF